MLLVASNWICAAGSGASTEDIIRDGDRCVGYSRLTGGDEAGALGHWLQFPGSAMEPELGGTQELV